MTEPTEVTIVHGIAVGMRSDAVALYENAFGAKFAVAVPDEDARLALLSESLHLKFAFGAVSDGRLVGLAGYKTDAGSFTDGITYSVLNRLLGLIRGTWAALIFSFYERPMKPGELLMDGIVVDESMRRQGIGTRLLDELASFARHEEFDSIRLDVIDTNPAAQRMYERNGFLATKTEHFGYLRWLLGFGGSTTLVRSTSKDAG